MVESAGVYDAEASQGGKYSNMNGGEPTIPTGTEDDLTITACRLLMMDAEPIVVVDQQEDAGQVLLLPNDMNAYRLQLSDQGVGYVTVEVPDWEVTIALFTHYSQQVKIIANPADIEEVRPLSLNPSCENITDERTHFHTWGVFPLEVRGEPNSEVTVAILKIE